MAFIGEAAVSKLFELVLGKSIDAALNFVADHKQVCDQLKKWKSKLSAIKAVLNNAEEKQIKEDGVQEWLADLQQFAYDVDDILDEFGYEELRLKLRKTEAQASTSKVRKLLPACCTGRDFSPSSFLFKNDMITKIKKITDKLNDLDERRGRFGLSSEGKKPARLQLTSVMDEAVEYVGRENEKREILDLLKTNNSNRVCVLSIVGMGGMGKTTLAQLVYNDASVKESFDHRAWVCVSDDFDAVKITKTILQSIDPSSPDMNDLNLLQEKLKEKISAKKFLLVLDDIWKEMSYNDWTVLRSPFGTMTKIIVTTRFHNVSSNMNLLKALHLDKLSHDDCLSILAQYALGAKSFNGHLQFKQVGEKIVKRCNGLPLAVKAIGSLLCTKNLNEWERVSESEIWDLPEDQCGIIPALRLSYHHLPSHLKRCFAYCSILPKDYEFEEEEIILLWRAEGFLQQKAKHQSKDLGSQYFQDLVLRSFFQISSKDGSRYVMHDLMNDLAQLVAGDICCRLENNKQNKFSSHSRHSSYVVKLYDTVKKFEPFYQTNSLRTFLPLNPDRVGGYLTNVVMVELLPRLNFLRVLSLCRYRITKLPDILENLKHLRYLNLSHTGIRCLPDSLCTLYHLETLLLKECSFLQEFPSKMENLVNLHCLDIRDTDLIKKMPLRIDNLTGLQRLPDFVVDEGEGHRIGELKNLSSLRGDFCLSGLENVNGPDAMEARLNEKPGINMLVLKWSSDFEKPTRKNEVEEQVLDSLHPPKKLEQLIIKNFGGERFSTWIADPSFMNLSSLKLLGCRNCKSLPPIGRLPSLKDLLIGDFNNVRMIGVEFFGQDQSIAIASLETLCFESLPKWEEWDPCEGNEQVSKFPSLRKLSIRKCPQLSGRLPTCLPSLQRLEIKECSSLVVSISSYPSLRELRVEGCEALVDECSSSAVEEVVSLQSVFFSSISKFSIAAERRTLRFAKSNDFVVFGDFNVLPEVLHAFTSLTKMQLDGCPSLVSFTEINFLPALKELRIYDCENLQYLIQLSSSGDICNRLQHLRIWYCPKLRSLFLNCKLPVMLKELFIWNCPVLECIAQDFHESTYLERIHICDAGNIKSLPQGLDKLSHLQEIYLEHCSNLVVCFEEIGLPTTNFRTFRIEECENIGGLPKCINNFTSLRELSVANCRADISFPEEGFPTNLTSLVISGAPRIYSSLVEWGFHRLTSLQRLDLSGEGCSNVVSFPEERMTLPRSLTSLTISNFANLEFIRSEGFQHLTSLEELRIGFCPKLTSLPEKDKLLSLGRLSIHHCPLLGEKRTGVREPELSKISHIPLVQIDFKNFIPKAEA